MKYIKNINEFRNELELPFDGKHSLFDKPIHIHLLDALLDISTKQEPTTYYSDWTKKSIEDAWESFSDKAYQHFKDFDSNNDDETIDFEKNSKFLEYYPPEDNKEYYSDDVQDYINGHDDATYGDIIKEFHLYDDLKENLNDEGLELYNSEIDRKVFEDRIDDTGALDTLIDNITDDGLIPIYRAISYEKGEEIDTYTNIKQNYGNVGIFWSYEFDGAEPHGGSYNNTFVLHGLVKPENINWVSTIYKTAYSLNYEKEVELLDKKDIMIVKITEYKSEIELKLPKPIIVRT